MSVVYNTLIIFAYYAIVVAMIPALMKRILRPDNEFIRKFQHIGYAFSVFFFIHLFDVWFLALVPAFVLCVVAFPLLKYFERFKEYSRFLVDRKRSGGELKYSLILSQLTFIALITVFWGVLGETYRFIIPVTIMSFGFGDALAALIGKKFGRRQTPMPYADENKTVLGSTAMFAASLLSIFLVLLIYTAILWWVILIIALMVAPLSTMLELYSKNGWDTITVPFGTAVLLYVSVLMLEWVGVML